jgi:hypothetical protein
MMLQTLYAIAVGAEGRWDERFAVHDSHSSAKASAQAVLRSVQIK